MVQVPNNVSNHLTAGLLKYFSTTGRHTSGINLFEKLRSQNVEVASLLAKVLFMGNEEVQGVRVLYEALKESPMDYVMLDTQAEFLLKKAETAPTPELRDERLRMALGCADRSTIAAPSEFGTWARLAQVYVAMEDWENALTILNSCPMFTYQDKDAPVMPEPKDVNLPTLPETRLDEIDSEPDSRFSEQVDPSLLGLRAAAYRGTFKQAYSILTEMTAKIGWDQLLKIRSNVFVMEDEYRNEKQEPSYPAKRNASTDALRGTPDHTTNGETAAKESAENEEAVNERKNENLAAEQTEDLERPPSAIDPEVVRKAEENVSLQADASRWQFVLGTMLTCDRVITRITSLVSTTSAYVSGGWTVCLWYFTKTFAYIPSGAPRWLSTGRRACSTRNRRKSGRFLAVSLSVYNIRTKRSRPTGHAWVSASAPRLSLVFSRYSRSKRAHARLSPRLSGW